MSRLSGKFTSSKGQGLTVLMVAVVASAFISGLVAVVMIDNLPSIYQRFVDDGALISETEFRHDNVVENYMPVSVHYSVAQATWEVGTTQTPGVDKRITGDQDESDRPLWSDEITGEYDIMMQWADNQSDAELQNYIQDLRYPRCRVSMLSASKMDVDPQWNTQDGMDNSIEVQALGGADSLVNSTCEDLTKQVRYRGSKSFLRIDSVNNQFPKLGTLTVNAIAEMENVSEQLDTDLDDGEVTDTSSCRSTKSQAKNELDARQKAENKVDAFFTAIVDEDHGIGSGSGDRGAREYLDEKTDDDQMCMLGVCAPNWLAGFNDDPISRLEVVNRDVAYQDGNGPSTNECGCDDYDCTENGYIYNGATCTPSDSLPSARCDNPNRGLSSCDTVNITCNGVQYYGDDTDLVFGNRCSPESGEIPSRTCVDHRYTAEASHKYDIDSMEVNVTLVDDRNNKEIPVDTGFNHPKITRTYYREFTAGGSYESVN